MMSSSAVRSVDPVRGRLVCLVKKSLSVCHCPCVSFHRVVSWRKDERLAAKCEAYIVVALGAAHFSLDLFDCIAFSPTEGKTSAPDCYASLWRLSTRCSTLSTRPRLDCSLVLFIVLSRAIHCSLVSFMECFIYSLMYDCIAFSPSEEKTSAPDCYASLWRLSTRCSTLFTRPRLDCSLVPYWRNVIQYVR